VPEADRNAFRRWFKGQFHEEVRPYNESYMALGTVILWVAWLFFNGGSTLSM
jgi:ammonia channel protein AmtB